MIENDMDDGEREKERARKEIRNSYQTWWG